MPISLSYAEIVSDMMLKSGMGLTLVILFSFRILAASVLPLLAHKLLYCLFCILLVATFLSCSPCVEASFKERAFIFLLFAPNLCLGLVGLMKRWKLKTIIVSAIMELLLFPIWFFIAFSVALCCEGGE